MSVAFFLPEYRPLADLNPSSFGARSQLRASHCNRPFTELMPAICRELKIAVRQPKRSKLNPGRTVKIEPGVSLAK
jgi:hypothetical protein